MALVFTNRGVNTVNGGSPWTSASFTPSNDSILVAMVSIIDAGGNNINLSISDSAGLTWTLRQSAVHNKAYGMASYVFTAPVTTGTSMTVTWSSTSGVGNISWALADVTGYNTGSPIGATGTTTGDSRSGAYSLPLSGTTASDSMVFCAAAENNGTMAMKATGGYVALQNTDISFFDTGEGYYTGGAISSFDIADLSSSYSYSACAIEVKAAAAGGSSNATFEVTESNDTLNGVSTSEIEIVFDSTEENDLINSSFSATVSATSNIVETDDSLSSDAISHIESLASFTITEDNDSISSDNDVDLVATSSMTESSDTAVIVVQSLVTGILNYAEEGTDTLSSSSVVLDPGEAVNTTLEITEDSDTMVSLVGLYLKRIQINSIKAPRNILQ